MIRASGESKVTCAILAVLFLMMFSMACVNVETDPEPPYPLNPYDYTYPEKEKLPPPWEHPEDFPAVTLTEPADGEFVAAGAVTVSGTYAGPSVDSVDVNGKTVTVAKDGSFTTTLNISNDEVVVPIIAMAKTEDDIVSSARATVIRGQSSAVDTLVERALLLDLDNRGLQKLSEGISSELDGIDLTAEMAKGAKAMEDKALFAIHKAYIADINIRLESTDDGLQIVLEVSGADFAIELLGAVTEVGVDGLVAKVLAGISIDSNNKLQLNIVDSTTNIASIDLQSTIIPDNTADIVALVLKYVAPLLVDVLVEGPVEGLLNSALNGLNLEINSDTLTYELIPASVETTSRALTMALDTDASVVPFDADFQPEGFLSTASLPPTFDGTTPSNGDPYGLALGLNDDMLNQLFYGLAGSGSLNFAITDTGLNADVYSILFFSFEDIDPRMLIEFHFSPTVAPVFYPDPTGLTKDIWLYLPGYQGQVMVDRGPVDGLWEAMSFTVDVTAPVSFILNDDNTLSLRLSDLGIHVKIIRNAVGQANVENIHRLLEEAFNDVLYQLIGEFESEHIALPELMGINMALAEFGGFGPQGDYLGAFIDLY